MPSLAIDGGQLELVAIARRPGVLSKVAIRPRGLAVPVAWAGIGADDLARVGALLDGERIEVVRWHRAATAYITAALGLGEDPPIVLLPGLGHARVLLGEIDVRGIAGWRGLNTVLASTLTGWRIRLEPLARTSAWRWLKAAMATRRPVAATVLGSGARGLRVEVHGLYAWLTSPRGNTPSDDLQVRVTRMNADEGRIFVTDRLSPAPTGQLALI